MSRPDSRDSADPLPAVPAGVARVASEKGGRHIETPEHRRAVRPGPAANDDYHHAHVRLQLRRRLRRDSADPADRRRAPRSASQGRRSDQGPSKGRRPQNSAQIVQGTGAQVTKTQEWGGLAGRLLLAVLVTIIVSRRGLLRVFLIPGLILLPIVFGYFAVSNLTWLTVGMFWFGLFTVGQFSFWGNYLPRVYPIHLRGTGESFAANIGGRMIGTSFALVHRVCSQLMPAGDKTGAVADAVSMAAAAAVVGTSLYLLNIILTFFLPEPQTEALPE